MDRSAQDVGNVVRSATDTLRLDLILALRGLGRRPTFAVAVIATLAVAIGSATAVFGVVYGVLLKPLPIRDQGRVVVLRKEHSSQRETLFPFAVADLVAYARETQVLEAVAGVQYDGAWQADLRNGDRVFPVTMTAVSGDFFGVLDVRPERGRLLNDRDDVVGGQPVAVISHSLWRREFAGDPNVVGRVVRGAAPSDAGVAASHGLIIVGVMPPGFDFPAGAQMWMPTLTINPDAAGRSLAPYSLVGRLRLGFTLDAARAELATFLARHVPDPGEPTELRPGVRTLESQIVGDVRPVLVILAAAVALLLLIAAVNVASLFLVRGVERWRELAVRAALGAGRPRLVRQLMTEGLALATVGAIVGVLVAWQLLRTLVALAPAGLPRLDDIGVDPMVVAMAAAMAGLGALVFSLVPALVATRSDTFGDSLRAGGRGATGGRAGNLGGHAIVVVQVALALVVLIGAGLLGKTLTRLQSLPVGYAADELTTAQLDLPSSLALADQVRQQAFYDRVLARLEARPDVSAATLVLVPPFSGSRGWDAFYTAEGQGPTEAAANPSPDLQAVLPGYFRTLGIPVLRGRGITAADREGAVPVVVVSEALARRTWPGQDPIGKRIKFGGADSASPWHTVVGVTGDVRYREIRTLRPVLFAAWAQQANLPPLTLIIARGRAGKPPALADIQREVDEQARGTLVTNVSTLDQRTSIVLAQPRFNALVVGAFAAMAVMLAALGLYAVMAAFVRQRTREIGMRLALGAQPRDVRRMVMGRGLAFAGVGIACGLALSLVATQVLGSVLFGVSPLDPATIVGSSVFLLSIAALACSGPLRKAVSVDPLIALRSDY